MRSYSAPGWWRIPEKSGMSFFLTFCFDFAREYNVAAASGLRVMAFDVGLPAGKKCFFFTACVCSVAVRACPHWPQTLRLLSLSRCCWVWVQRCSGVRAPLCHPVKMALHRKGRAHAHASARENTHIHTKPPVGPKTLDVWFGKYSLCFCCCAVLGSDCRR